MLVSRGLAELGAAGCHGRMRLPAQMRNCARSPGLGRHPGGRGGTDMATTAAAVTVCRGAEWIGEAAWVGDSTLWHLGAGAAGDWLPAGTGRSEADYHSSRVKPLPSDDGACTWCGFRISGGALFVMTDGVANPLRWIPKYGRTRALVARPPDPFTFAAQVGFARKSHLDDRTVVGIWADRG